MTSAAVESSSSRIFTYRVVVVVAVAEPMPYQPKVDALVDQPRSMPVPDLVGRVPERQAGDLEGFFLIIMGSLLDTFTGA